jgi:hypothetical protein
MKSLTMISVDYSPEVILFLKELTSLLYSKGYFSYPETAKDYVDKLTYYIENDIATKTKKVAPKHFSKFGKNMFYVHYKPNKRTTWYIFFNVKDSRYLIRYITNNHASAQHIRGLT